MHRDDGANAPRKHSSSHQPEPSLSYVIGVDGGATKTEAVIANLQGQPVGAGRSGCGNWEVVGENSAAETIFAAVRQALERANVTLSEVRSLHMGLAGHDWPEDEPRLRGALERHIGQIPLTLENDAFLGARACTPTAHGISVSAGSGVCASYLGAEGEKYNYGYFGELGGGFPIDQLALYAIIRAEDGRGPKTALTPAILKATGHSSVAELLHAITRKSYSLSHTAIRPSLFQTANRGDAVAVGVVSAFGRELGRLATNLIQKYSLQGAEPYVVASGSLFTKTGPLLFDVFQKFVHDADASAQVKLNNRPPVAGAVRAALQACGVQTNSNWETTSSSYEGALNG
jgi:N-acetylglucosamine kinase-like BadF-type ATPase